MHISLVAALTYWVIVVIWAIVLTMLVVSYVRNRRTFGTTRLLLWVLAIDTCRNILENIYFGFYFGGQYQLFPASFVSTLGQPALLLLPKLANVAAGCVVLGVLLFRWLPLAVRERSDYKIYADHLENLAAVDGLTGLYNRRYFEAQARAELARFQRYLRPLTVLAVDIDHFKSVNDRFGHAMGDTVLRSVASLCQQTKRDSDIVARIGGEEFAILLPETNIDAALVFAERLRRHVAQCSHRVSDESFAVTVSIGITESTLAMSGIETLLQRADEALYDAKRSGRDCVRVAAAKNEPKSIRAAE
jgi:diguanylate cyclase (GGDEF)-like protein